MLASDIIRELRSATAGEYAAKVISDSADPRLIQEIANGGILIYPVLKGGGSIMAGITKMQDMELFVTRDSLNLQEELRNYTWDRDKDGNYINQPIDAFNHCVAAARYYVLGELLGQVQAPSMVRKSDLGIF